MAVGVINESAALSGPGLRAPVLVVDRARRYTGSVVGAVQEAGRETGAVREEVDHVARVQKTELNLAVSGDGAVAPEIVIAVGTVGEHRQIRLIVEDLRPGRHMTVDVRRDRSHRRGLGRRYVEGIVAGSELHHRGPE